MAHSQSRRSSSRRRTDLNLTCCCVCYETALTVVGSSLWFMERLAERVSRSTPAMRIALSSQSGIGATPKTMAWPLLCGPPVNTCERCSVATLPGAAASAEAARLSFSTRCRVLREIDSLYSISGALALGGDFSAAMAALYAQLTQATGLFAGLLAIVDREHGELVADERAGTASRTGERIAVRLGEGLQARWVWPSVSARFPRSVSIRSGAPDET